MTIFRHYTLIARDGETVALKSALDELARKVLPLDGCEGIEIYQDDEDQRVFFFIERWTNGEAHQESGEFLGKAAFSPLMASVASPPTVRYLTGGSVR
jgi:quinol monooxygenase YgiN